MIESEVLGKAIRVPIPKSNPEGQLMLEAFSDVRHKVMPFTDLANYMLDRTVLVCMVAIGKVLGMMIHWIL